VTLRMASVGFWILGTGRSSTATSKSFFRTTARMVDGRGMVAVVRGVGFVMGRSIDVVWGGIGDLDGVAVIVVLYR
jgi:hypothetical protein